jgi:hypothetical protein
MWSLPEGELMTLSAPTQAIFWIAVVLAVIALIAYFGVIGAVAAYAFWILIMAFIVLAVGCLMRGT